MPVNNKEKPFRAGSYSLASPSKHSQYHALKRRHHPKLGSECDTMHPSKAGCKQEGHGKPTSSGPVPGTRETSQPPEQGLLNHQPVGSADAVEDDHAAPAFQTTGRVITARLKVKPTGENVTETGPHSKKSSQDKLAVHSQYPWLEAILGKVTKASSATINEPTGRIAWSSYVASIAICGAVVFTVMSIIVAGAFATKAVIDSYIALGMRVSLIDDLAQACDSQSCREALWLINASCLTSVDICHDFYGFVCGRWGAKGPLGEGLSYSLALDFNYTSKLDQTLPRILAWSATKDTDLYKVALVYRSCVNFFANTTTNLDNMFRAARVDPRVFLKAENFSQLFSTSIRSVIDNKLTSVWKVVHPENGGVGILTGTSMLVRSFIPEIHEALLEQLASTTGDKGFVEMVKPIATLDGFIKSVTEPHSGETALDEVLTSRDDIPAYGVYWKKALYELPRPRSVENQRANTVRTNNAGAIQSIVRKLASVPLNIAKAYMLLVPFATYLGFELKTASRRGFLPDTIRAKQCVGYLNSMFGVRAQAVLMEVMKPSKALASANQMWKNLRHKAQAMANIGAGFTLGRESLLNATFEVYGGGVNPGTGSVPPASYTGDFIANVIMLTRYTDKQTELNPRLSSTHSEAEVGKEFLVPDFFYPDATEASVNYGTLGSYMASILFTSSLPKRFPNEYVNCLEKYTDHHNIPFDKTDWQRYVKMNWSMNVAFRSLPTNTGARDHVLQGRYFFLRYAIFFCGENMPVRMGLQYAAKSSRSFATIFNCNQPPINPC